MKTKEEIKIEIENLERKLENANYADDRHAQYILDAKIRSLKWVINQE